MTQRYEDQLDQWTAPKASPELRERVLAAAREAANENRPLSIEERLWRSRIVRYGSLAAASVLVAINLALFTHAPSPPMATKQKIKTDDPQITHLLERHQTSRTRLKDSQHLIAQLAAQDSGNTDLSTGESI